jgi:hypothetical protein
MWNLSEVMHQDKSMATHEGSIAVDTRHEQSEHERDLKKQTEVVKKLQRSATRDVTVIVRVRPLLDVDHSVYRNRHSKDGSEESHLKEGRGVVIRQSTIGLLRTQTTAPTTARISATSNDRILHVPPSNEASDNWKLSKTFTFDTVLSEADTTDTAFSWTGEVAVSEVMCGVNAIVFAYGQTGSGKTYTLLGKGAAERRDCDDHRDEGIAIRTFQTLQQELKPGDATQGLVKYSICVGAVQIYLNQVLYACACTEMLACACGVHANVCMSM